MDIITVREKNWNGAFDADFDDGEMNVIAIMNDYTEDDRLTLRGIIDGYRRKLVADGHEDGRISVSRVDRGRTEKYYISIGDQNQYLIEVMIEVPNFWKMMIKADKFCDDREADERYDNWIDADWACGGISEAFESNEELSERLEQEGC